MEKNIKIAEYLKKINTIKIYDTLFLKKLDFEYYIDNDLNINQKYIKILSNLILKLTIMDFPNLENQNYLLLNKIIELFEKSDNILNYFHKYKLNIENKYENISYDDINKKTRLSKNLKIKFEANDFDSFLEQIKFN